MEMMYCILCERDIMVTEGNHWHDKLLAVDYETGELIMYDCEGILVYCAPPSLPDDWIESVVEPSPDEMEIIDIDAFVDMEKELS